MSDISNQLIKDSFNYVLQSDLSTGVVYRIGGLIPVNPIFQSGLTVTGGFTYSGAGEQLGYALLTDGTGYAYWGPVSAATPSSGVTSITVGNGLSANSSTGAVTIVFTGSTNVSGLTYYVTGSTPSGSTFISGDRWFNTTNGDELVYVNDGNSAQWIQICCGGSGGGGGSSVIQGITGITGTSGVSATTTDYGTTIINTAPDQTVTITGGTNIEITGSYPNFGVNFTGTTGSNFTGGTVTGPTNFTNGLTANTISATTYQNLPSSFQLVRINNTTQFSANTGTFLNFSGINITITSAATNTLVFSAATGGGGGGGVTQITAGNGISISPTGGTGNVTINSTVTDTILIASNSCVVKANGSTYIGNSIFGWGNQDWDFDISSFTAAESNCLIPIPKTTGELNICGIAYINDSDPTNCNLIVSANSNTCPPGRFDNRESNALSFDSNGILCFTYNPKVTLSACTDYVALGFKINGASTAMDCKISYTITN
jgi:hypothetical protein